MSRRLFFVLHLAVGLPLLLAALVTSAAAMEGLVSPYLRGYRDFFAGVLPSPGLQFRYDTYMYSGTERSNIPQGQLGVRLKVFANIAGATIVTPYQILGGDYGFAVRAAVSDVTADQTVATPRGKVARNGSLRGLNDIVLSPIIVGWHSGYFHWNVSTTVWLPAGDYDETRLVNTGKNYWSVSPQFAATYFDPKSGWDISATAIYVVNFENSATSYRSGDIAHLDVAVGKSFSPQFKLGVVGFYVQQVTADSGAGAILGDRKVRVAGLGPAATFSFTLNNVPMSLVAKYHREFSAQNTTQGDAGTLSVRAKF